MECNTEFDEINEAEEEALLKSDEECEDDNMSVENDDSLDSDDSNEQSDKMMEQFNKLVKEIKKQPYLYDKYLELCKIAHLTDDLDCIRKAYNMFSAIFPLTSDLWLKYILIEENVATSSKEVNKVEELFQKAASDYYSFDLGRKYGEFASRTDNPEKIWNEVMGTYGLECMHGQELFQSYREYLSSNPQLSEEEKLERYVHSYMRELQYPLNNMEESYIEFKVSCEKNKTNMPDTIDWDKIDKKYFRAKDHLQKILPYEENLKKIDLNSYRERAETYMEYIKSSDEFLDENVLQTVYERMVADCCLNPECWLSYIDYIAYRDEVGRPRELQDLPLFQQKATDVNRRALRNCTWSEKLYIKMMQLLEKQDAPREKVQEVLENSMSAGFQTPEPVVAIWLEYLTYLRRHTNWEDDAECDILRKNFNLAWTILGQQWGVLADCNCEILQFWGRLEYGPLRDPVRGKELWTTVMESADNASKSGLWIEFVQLEMRRDLEATRRLFQKALNSKGLDNPAVIASAWERFERCNGTMKSLSTCQRESSRIMQQYLVPKELPAGADDRGIKSGKKLAVGKGVKRKSDTIPNGVETKKMKPPEVVGVNKEPQREVNKKREVEFRVHETQEIDMTKDNKRIFLSNLDYNLDEDAIREHLGELNIKSIDLIRSANGRSRGFGYLELEDETEVEKALALDRRNINGRPLFISSVLRDKEKRQKFKYSDAVEPKKLFIKSLPHDTTKEELEKIFSSFGELEDVRLVYHKSGNFKNIAYVEFKQESSAGKAVLATNQMELRGHRLNVAISAPPPKVSAAHITADKLLGLAGSKRNKMDQKPRMSLIPTVVRKNFEVTRATNTTITSTATINGNKFQGKSNADFRSLLQNKN